MDFWNDNTRFVLQINGKCAFKKYVIVISKDKKIKIDHHQIEEFKKKMY
jgi:hypothetical protein